MKKTLIALLLVFAMILPLAGNAEGSATTEVVVGLVADPGSLDPFTASNTGNIATWPTIYEGLFYLDGMGGEAQPGLAKSFELVSAEEGKWVWAFELNEGIVDSEGNPYTSNDVAWYVQKKKDSGVDANVSYIDEIEVLDDTHFNMHLNANQIGMIENMATLVKGVTKASYEAKGNEFAKSPITTSRYKVTSYVTGSQIVCEKRDNYWGEGKSQAIQSTANVDKITFKVITDATQMDIALQNHEVDMIPSVASADLFDFLNEDLTVKDGYYTESYLRGATLIMFFNNYAGNAFANEDLRKAIAYAVDNEAIMKNVLGGQGTALCTVGSECFGDFVMDWYNEPYYGRGGANMEEAMKLLASSGFDTTQTIRIITETDNTIMRVAQIVDAYLRAMGLNPSIESFEAAQYEEKCADPEAWDIFIGYRGAGDYLANMWRWTFDQDIRGGYTANFVHDEEMQAMLKKCLDPASHTAEDMTAFKNYLNEKCYAYGLFSQKMYVLGSDKVTDFVFDSAWGIVPGACSYK